VRGGRFPDNGMQSFPETSFAWLADAAREAGRVLVLTVNNRHARRLLTDLAAHDPARTVRQMPHIMPFAAWMRQAADALGFTQPMAAHVLDAFGTQQLWAQVIEQQEPQRPLLDAAQTARLAMQADRLMTDWQLHLPDAELSLETARFVQWRKAYLAQLARLDAQDDARLTEAVLHAAARGALLLPFDAVVFSGFTELAPAWRTLLTHMQRQGLRVMRLSSTQQTSTQVVRSVSQTHEAQWRDAAAWAARRLRLDPHGRFAIVAAQLEADMPFAHRALREALMDAPYNMAVARPLADWPLIRAAQAWLRVLTAYARGSRHDPGCEPAAVGAALLAGACVGGAVEASARAALDAFWRRQGALRVARSALEQQLDRRTPLLARAWQTALAQAMQDDARAPLDVWVDRFRRDLRTLAFPGDAAQDSAAYQTLQAFDLALDRAAAQAFAFGALRRHQAWNLLDRLLRQTRFQPMRDPAARLDVLGMLEADGGRWDAVWVLGLHDAVLPAAPRPNPLLPVSVLRDAGTPRATLARELQWAQASVDALRLCAPRVLFSHAQQQGEEPLRVSPLLADLPEVTVAAAVDNDWRVGASVDGAVSAAMQDAAPCVAPDAPILLETLLDMQGPPLTGKALRGGIGVIDTQARHPLWAFVKYRLGASQLRDYAEVADPNTRGNFLHHAMELIWRLLPDQAALQQSWEHGRLAALAAQAVAQAADKHLQDYAPTLKRLEMQRAETVVRDWLDVERQRAPFRVHAVEQTVHWRDGPLELRVRLDRVDALDDGVLAVIDYKTGSGSIAVRNDWMRDRPVNVQLPFYAAMLPHAQRQVAALMLVKLHARGIEVRGLARDPDLKGVDVLTKWPMFERMTWDEVMRHWRAAIQTIARELADGVASNVVPRMADLQYCDVLPFLRLNETVIPGQTHVG